jgi:hypothetical protein
LGAYEKKMQEVQDYLTRIPNEGAEAHKVYVHIERSGKVLTHSPKSKDIPDSNGVAVFYFDWFPSAEARGPGKHMSLVTFATSLDANMGDMEISFPKPTPLSFRFRSYTKHKDTWEVELESKFEDARLVSLGTVCETPSGRSFKVFRVWIQRYKVVQNQFDRTGSKLGSKTSTYDGVRGK